jgi:hypothetical protein
MALKDLDFSDIDLGDIDLFDVSVMEASDTVAVPETGASWSLIYSCSCSLTEQQLEDLIEKKR